MAQSQKRAAQNKTTRNDGDVAAFLEAVADGARRRDAQRLCELMTNATGARPAMWGSAIVGFGAYTYRYASGRTGNAAAVGFSPRKQNLTVYLPEGVEPFGALLDRLGPYSVGKSCLYIKHLDDIDTGVLTDIVARSFEAMNGRNVTP